MLPPQRCISSLLAKKVIIRHWSTHRHRVLQGRISTRDMSRSLYTSKTVFQHGNEQSPTVSSSTLIHHLERTSLVDFDNAEALERLNEAIKFATQLMEVNTEGVEPLVTVLENESLYLREDSVEPTSRKAILKNASITEEDYFVAPPGNIPLEHVSKEFRSTETETTLINEARTESS